MVGGEKEEIEPWMHDLYLLVTKAPRCPKMMSFVRTVRHSKRLPSSWFFSLNKKKIEKGESVILPTFFSTANLSIFTNYDSHGIDSVSADFDEYPAEKNCCVVQLIVSKGVPMLPLGDFKSNELAHENEILLPPGIELVYLGADVFEFDKDNDVHMECYVARVRSFEDGELGKGGATRPA